jgi:signal transduction histidine kinase
MGKVKTAAAGRRHRLRDAPLRVSFVLYMVVTAVAATVVCAVAINWMDEVRIELYNKYSALAEEIPGAGDGHMEYSPEDEALDNVLRALQALAIPLSYLGAIVLCAVIFYRRKLKRPIELLDAASQKIAENDLDFTVETPCGNELGRLCASFEKMRAALLMLNREHWAQMEERRRLNAAFAHDLRTPLTVLRGRACLLGAGLPPDSEAAADVRVMQTHIERLVRYADAMSSLQRMEDLEVRRVRVPLGELAAALRETAEILLAGRGVELVCGEGEADVDSEVVMQVCGNILSNSARYARARVEIELRAGAEGLSVSVTDDGGGFTKEGLEKAPAPFYKGEGSGSGHLGLGLNICDILCRRHNGRLCIENVPNGARVTAVFGRRQSK